MYKNLSPRALGVSGFQSELIELALSHGFKGLEIDLGEYLKQCSRGTSHAQRLLASAGIRIGGPRLPFPLSAEEEQFAAGLQMLSEGVEHLKTIGCDHLVSVLEPASDMLPYHENFELHRKRLAQLAELLDPHEIRVGVGIRGTAAARAGAQFEFIHDLNALKMLVEASAGSTGVLLDSWELVASGGSLSEAQQITPERLVAVAIADGPSDRPAEEWADTDRRLPEVEGAVDNVGLLRWLAEVGFDGPVTPCPHRDQFKGNTREGIVKQTAEKLDAVWTAAGLTPAGKPMSPADQTA